ncbi:MAG: phosphoribosyltransferase family protein [Patescibacteria group bacterium]
MSAVVEVWRWLTDVIQRLLFPVFCLRCGVEGDFLCAACQKTVPPVPVQVCVFCSVSSPNGRTCSACSRHALDGVCVRGMYDDWSWRVLITAWKFHGAAITPLLSRLLEDSIAVLPESYRTGKFMVVPVPLARRRQRERGRNQSAELANALVGHQLIVAALTRVRETAQQSQLSKKDRIRNVHAAFKANPALVQPDTNYLLIDDVVTTGATLEQAAQALKEVGATSVWAVTLARSRLL